MKLLATAAIIALAAGLAGCGGPHGASTQAKTPVAAPAPPPPPPPPPTPYDLETQLRPPTQVRLEALAKALEDAEIASGSEINGRETFMKAFQAFCSAMQGASGTLSGWTGHITGIHNLDATTDVSTKPAFSLETPGGLKVFNYLDRGSGLMNSVRSLKVGDFVQFSIALNHKDDHGETYNECQDPDYNSPRGPLVNKALIGEVVSITPISTKDQKKP